MVSALSTLTLKPRCTRFFFFYKKINFLYLFHLHRHSVVQSQSKSKWGCYLRSYISFMYLWSIVCYKIWFFAYSLKLIRLLHRISKSKPEEKGFLTFSLFKHFVSFLSFCFTLAFFTTLPPRGGVVYCLSWFQLIYGEKNLLVWVFCQVIPIQMSPDLNN